MLSPGKWSRTFAEPFESEFWKEHISNDRRTFTLICIIGILSCVVLFAFGILRQGLGQMPGSSYFVAVINSVLFFLGIAISTSQLYTKVARAAVSFGLGTVFASMLVLLHYGREDGRYVSSIIVSMLLLSLPFIPHSFWVKIVHISLALLALFVSKYIQGEAVRHIVIYSASYFVLLSVFSFAHDRSLRLTYSLKQQVRNASAKMESILRKIYPAPVFEKVKNMEFPSFVEAYEQVSVMFVDIAGFTELAASRSPNELVAILDDLFSRIDASCKQSAAVKIKTIGDAYLAVTGMDGDPNHASVMADLALEIRAAVWKYSFLNNFNLNVRIGIHTGKVVAGIIGRETSHFDLWGETVNLASRLESHGIPGKIQVSEKFAELVTSRFSLYERGAVVLKGMGSFKCFFLDVLGHSDSEIRESPNVDATLSPSAVTSKVLKI